MYNFKSKVVKDKMVQWIRNWFMKNGDGCNAVIGISGGKDSTVVAALCVEALGKDRVIGVMMPNGIQKDLSDSIKVCEFLGIENYTINIKDSVNHVLDQMKKSGIEITEQTRTNLPARIRMSTLYAISQSLNGRVSNNCNLSEDIVGFFTRWGDGAGDFAPLANLTTVEVVRIGEELGLPYELVHKTPVDGLNTDEDGSYVTDEQVLGLTYENIHSYIREPGPMEFDEFQKICKKENKSRFKLKPIPKFTVKDNYLYE